MLMDVPSNTNKPLDGFYNELRRKYPDAFTRATDLGRRNESLQKLPRLEKTPSPILGIPPNSPNVASWSPESFLSKVKYQKTTHNEQRKEVEKPQQSGNAVIIKNQAIPMPTWTRKDYLEAQNGASFQLPTLRTQIEQNKVELKNRLNPPKKTATNQRSTLQPSNSVQAKPSSDYTTTNTSRDYTTNEYTNDYTTTQTTRDYTTTKTSRDYSTNEYTNDYASKKSSRDDTTNEYTNGYTAPKPTNRYTTTKPIEDYITTQTTRDYTTTNTSRDYITTKSTNDHATKQTTNDYTMKQTTRDYTTTNTSRDYITTKSTNDHATKQTTNDYTTKQTTRDYTTTSTSRDYITTKSTNDHATKQTTNDYTMKQTTRDYNTTKTTMDYPTTQTIRNDNTKTTKDYHITQTIKDYNTTKTTKDYPTTQAIKDYNTTNDYIVTKTTKDYATTIMSTKDYTNTGDSFPASGVKSDPLGTIMKELLPNKPSRIMKDMPKSTNRLSNNGGCVSDSDSGVSVCSPMKVFRPKIRSPQAPPASRDIIKKFSAKPKRTSEPLKADHSLVQENILSDRTQIVQLEDNPVTRNLKSLINFNDKIPQGAPRTRVRFEDESEEDAEFRYRERRLLDRTPTTKMGTNISPDPQIKYMEKNAKPETTERSSSLSKEGEKAKSPDQQTTTLPHRRQPFPPNIAKKVLIDIPRGGLPSRRLPQIRVSTVMKDISNQQFSPRNVTSLEGITMSFKSTNEWGAQSQSVRANKEHESGHHSLSSLETLDSGTTEASSEFTIMKMEWGASDSSLSSGNQSRSSSQNRDLNVDHPSQNKGPEMSFYSKVRRSLRLKKKLHSEATSGSRHSDNIPKSSKDLEADQSSSTSLQLDGGGHGKSSPYSAAVCRLPNQAAADDGIPSHVGMNRTKKDVMRDLETQGPVRIHPVKVPYSPVRMVQSLLKKGRAKDYVVRVPSPPPQEARPPTSNVRSSGYRREQIPGLASGRVLATQSDSSRLVELERPKTGFSGLYLTKKNQNGYSGLYVVQLSGAFTSSFPQGILEVGDEILEINRLQAKDLRLDEIYTLLEESSCVLLRVSRNISSSS